MPSPVADAKPVEQAEMDFFDALKQVKAGKVIYKREWPISDIACMRDHQLQIYTRGEWHTWIISTGDLEGTDYVVR